MNSKKQGIRTISLLSKSVALPRRSLDIVVAMGRMLGQGSRFTGFSLTIMEKYAAAGDFIWDPAVMQFLMQEQNEQERGGQRSDTIYLTLKLLRLYLEMGRDSSENIFNTNIYLENIRRNIEQNLYWLSASGGQAAELLRALFLAVPQLSVVEQEQAFLRVERQIREHCPERVAIPRSDILSERARPRLKLCPHAMGVPFERMLAAVAEHNHIQRGSELFRRAAERQQREFYMTIMRDYVFARIESLVKAHFRRALQPFETQWIKAHVRQLHPAQLMADIRQGDFWSYEELARSMCVQLRSAQQIFESLQEIRVQVSHLQEVVLEEIPLLLANLPGSMDVELSGQILRRIAMAQTEKELEEVPDPVRQFSLLWQQGDRKERKQMLSEMGKILGKIAFLGGNEEASESGGVAKLQKIVKRFQDSDSALSEVIGYPSPHAIEHFSHPLLALKAMLKEAKDWTDDVEAMYFGQVSDVVLRMPDPMYREIAAAMETLMSGKAVGPESIPLERLEFINKWRSVPSGNQIQVLIRVLERLDPLGEGDGKAEMEQELSRVAAEYLKQSERQRRKSAAILRMLRNSAPEQDVPHLIPTAEGIENPIAESTENPMGGQAPEFPGYVPISAAEGAQNPLAIRELLRPHFAKIDIFSDELPSGELLSGEFPSGELPGSPMELPNPAYQTITALLAERWNVAMPGSRGPGHPNQEGWPGWGQAGDKEYWQFQIARHEQEILRLLGERLDEIEVQGNWWDSPQEYLQGYLPELIMELSASIIFSDSGQRFSSYQALLSAIHGWPENQGSQFGSAQLKDLALYPDWEQIPLEGRRQVLEQLARMVKRAIDESGDGTGPAKQAVNEAGDGISLAKQPDKELYDNGRETGRSNYAALGDNGLAAEIAHHKQEILKLMAMYLEEEIAQGNFNHHLSEILMKLPGSVIFSGSGQGFSPYQTVTSMITQQLKDQGLKADLAQLGQLAGYPEWGQAAPMDHRKILERLTEVVKQAAKGADNYPEVVKQATKGADKGPEVVKQAAPKADNGPEVAKQAIPKADNGPEVANQAIKETDNGTKAVRKVPQSGHGTKVVEQVSQVDHDTKESPQIANGPAKINELMVEMAYHEQELLKLMAKHLEEILGRVLTYSAGDLAPIQSTWSTMPPSLEPNLPQSVTHSWQKAILRHILAQDGQGHPLYQTIASTINNQLSDYEHKAGPKQPEGPVGYPKWEQVTLENRRQILERLTEAVKRSMAEPSTNVPQKANEWMAGVAYHEQEILKLIAKHLEEIAAQDYPQDRLSEILMKLPGSIIFPGSGQGIPSYSTVPSEAPIVPLEAPTVQSAQGLMADPKQLGHLTDYPEWESIAFQDRRQILERLTEVVRRSLHEANVHTEKDNQNVNAYPKGDEWIGEMAHHGQEIFKLTEKQLDEMAAQDNVQIHLPELIMKLPVSAIFPDPSQGQSAASPGLSQGQSATFPDLSQGLYAYQTIVSAINAQLNEKWLNATSMQPGPISGDPKWETVTLEGRKPMLERLTKIVQQAINEPSASNGFSVSNISKEKAKQTVNTHQEDHRWMAEMVYHEQALLRLRAKYLAETAVQDNPQTHLAELIKRLPGSAIFPNPSRGFSAYQTMVSLIAKGLNAQENNESMPANTHHKSSEMAHKQEMIEAITEHLERQMDPHTHLSEPSTKWPSLFSQPLFKDPLAKDPLVERLPVDRKNPLAPHQEKAIAQEWIPTILANLQPSDPHQREAQAPSQTDSLIFANQQPLSKSHTEMRHNGQAIVTLETRITNQEHSIKEGQRQLEELRKMLFKAEDEARKNAEKQMEWIDKSRFGKLSRKTLEQIKNELRLERIRYGLD